MADDLMDDKQLEQLIESSALDLTEALKYFPETVRNVQEKTVTEALKTNDTGKLAQMAHQSPEMRNLISAVQNRMYVQRIAQAVPMLRAAEEKRKKGFTLSQAESSLLSQKANLEKGVEWCKKKYPKTFEIKAGSIQSPIAQKVPNTPVSTNFDNAAETQKEIQKNAAIQAAAKDGIPQTGLQTADIANPAAQMPFQVNAAEKPALILQTAAPKTAQQSEQAQLRDEALKSVKLDPLEEIKVSGDLKKPVIKLPDGTKMPVSDAKKTELTEQAKQVESKKLDNDNAIQKNRQQQHQLSSARTGTESKTNVQTNIRGNSR